VSADVQPLHRHTRRVGDDDVGESGSRNHRESERETLALGAVRWLLLCRRPSSGRDAAASCLTAGRAAVEACDWASPPAGATGGGATGGGQSVSPAVAEMVGWRRDRTASMISLGSIPCK
jgi:hypothetical protein